MQAYWVSCIFMYIMYHNVFVIVGLCLLQNDKFKMSRQLSQVNRGQMFGKHSRSIDDRVKTLAKRQRQLAEPDKKLEIEPIKTSESQESKNADVLLGIALMMVDVAKKYPEKCIRSHQLKMLEMTIEELTLMRRLEDVQKEHNRGKMKELRSKMECLRERKAKMAAYSEQMSLYRSRSPKGRDKIIAAESSPNNFHQVPLIERNALQEQINQNNQIITFQSIKKKNEICLERMFEQFDRIADKLNLTRGEKTALTFKNYLARIQNAIDTITHREAESKKTLWEEITILNKKIQLLTQQNQALMSQLQMMPSRLQQNQTIHNQSYNQQIKKYTELLQEFDLLTREKIDLETSLSKQSKKHKEMFNLFRRKAAQILCYTQQAKSLHFQLWKLSKDYKSSIQCISWENVNSIISAYTEERIAKASRDQHLKKQVLQLKMENIRLNKEMKEFAEKERIEIQRRRSEMIVVRTLNQEILGGRKEMLIEKMDSVEYAPEEKISVCLQTDLLQPSLAISPKMINIELHSRRHGRESGIIEFKSIKKQERGIYETRQTQTDIQQKVISIITHNEQTQTPNLQLFSASIQAIPSTNDSAIQSQSLLLSFCHAYDQLIVNFTSKSHISTETDPKQLSFYPPFNHTIFNHEKITFQAGINTESSSSMHSQHHEVQSSNKNNTQQYIQSSQKIPPALSSEDLIGELLAEAEECTIVPEIWLLREELLAHRQEIDRLNKLLASEQKKEEDTVFQFCY